MIIRLATETDLPALLRLVERVVPVMRASGNLQWDAGYPNAGVFLADIQQQQLWVAEADGEVAGVAALTTQQDEEYAQLGWDLTEQAIVTHRLAVDPGFQGRGIARRLLEKAEEIALERGISVLRVDTNTENKATQQLFPRMGYQPAGELTLHFRPGLRFLGYEKRLSSGGSAE
ncbi:GNAT family N-acetyltransferase [Siphonobacter aquaeclarae]|jgi:GNAT superfamily N-acetyltransferase|uniref:N-acetylglutamate synthase, GNAT family n=1 Tax=Siphonobacter aquaeclarae TaxID=563176 RepID=A0A1G9L805_9BACT|nr:GNAT family N-acetyltransferase [Siphonobacter aquaeclarae]SDL58129.1 N-acetylglutamate synthase, GNAT family [Siphonobacter aquaeclarae]